MIHRMGPAQRDALTVILSICCVDVTRSANLGETLGRALAERIRRIRNIFVSNNAKPHNVDNPTSRTQIILGVLTLNVYY